MIALNGSTNTFDSEDRFLTMLGPSAPPLPGSQRSVGSDFQALGRDFQKLGSDLGIPRQDGGTPAGGTSGGDDMMSEVVMLLQEIEQMLESQSQARNLDEGSPEPGGAQPAPGGDGGDAPQASSPGNLANANPGAPTPTGGASQDTGRLPGTEAPSRTVDTGTGVGQTYVVHNATDRDQSFLYSDASGHKAVMQLKAGEAGAFTGGNNQPGIRIQTCGPDGETRSPANQALFEAGSQTTAQGVVNNPDVSDVDGNLSFDGRGTDIEISNNLGKRVGNMSGNAYRNWNDDTKGGSSNPMTMAQTPATKFDIYFSDSNQSLSTPGIR